MTGDVTGDVTGNADTATKIASITNSDIVQLGGAQTLTGAKTFSGGITATTVTTTSDPRLKNNLVTIDDCLSKIEGLNAYSYTWKDENLNKGLQFGVNADEVGDLYEGLVDINDETGYKSVNYNGIVGLLLGSIKELKEEITLLKSKI